jgi:hypothetical protein
LNRNLVPEISQSTTLQNSGTLTLGQGGDFKDSSNIGNSGALEVARGTLNVDVNIANNGGSIVVDRGVTLALSDGGAVAGGSLTLASRGVLDIEKSAVSLPAATPDGTLEGVLVSGTIAGAPSMIEVGLTSAAVLELTDGTRIADGNLKIGAGSTLEIEKSAFLLASGTPDATLDGVTVAGTNGLTPGTIGVGAAAVLTLDDAATITDGSLTIAGGSTLDVESTAGATLLDVTVTGVAGAPGSTIEIGTNTPSGSILTLDDGTTIIGGTINNNGTIDVTGSSATGGPERHARRRPRKYGHRHRRPGHHYVELCSQGATAPRRFSPRVGCSRGPRVTRSVTPSGIPGGLIR